MYVAAFAMTKPTTPKPASQRSALHPLIVVLVGEPLSGKEVASQYLVQRYGFVGFRFSKILNDILGRLQLPVNRPNQTDLANALRERFGGGVLADVVLREIAAGSYPRVVIDGLRHPAEFESLRKLPGFVLVYLTAPLALRFARVKNRREKAGEHRFSLADFKRDEKLPNELFIQRLGRKAQVRLVNDKSLRDLHRQIEEQVIQPYLT